MESGHLHTTRGIVLRSVKYGETSLIVTLFTERFGLQSYIVNGVRTSTRKGGGRANHFQPGALLELVVYHNEFRNLQRIKEFKWAVLYEQLYFDVTKNCVALFMIELLQKVIRQPEANEELYHFIEDAFLHLDKAPATVTANYPLFFITQLTYFSGFRISDEYSEERPYLDLAGGDFVKDPPQHTHSLGKPYTGLISQLLKVMHPSELEQIGMNHEIRRVLLQAFLTFYALHTPEFGTLRTLDVLQEVLR
jgi:DNA repair protein RecO (recombination protein O)